MASEIPKCEHGKELKDDPSFSKKVKTVHKILSKLSTYIKATIQEIEHENVALLMQIVMRELNKTNFKGIEKRDMAIFIMETLLESFGVPEIVAHYTASLLEKLLENIYNHGMHRYKRGKCSVI